MAITLKIEYRAVLTFLTKEEVSPSVIKQCLDSVYAEVSRSYSTMKGSGQNSFAWEERALRMSPAMVGP